jgi:hypothetical protein
MRTEAVSPGIKPPERVVDTPPHCSVDVKNENYTSATRPSAFVAGYKGDLNLYHYFQKVYEPRNV